MKTKFFLTVFVVLFVAAFAVAPAFAQGEVPPPVEPLSLPALLQALLAAGIAWLVTQGLKSLSRVISFDLSGAGTAITGALVTAAIVFFNAMLAAVPAGAREPVASVLGLIVSILSAYGIAGTLKSFQPQKK